ncbi:hypothetical protein UVI_02035780 [Ustilaginoidea virens]|uniref:Dynein light intermediate chain n=1 Tax=Ustilaginoidea virens TaxID=1159556 RepID=A0A1B5KSZ1_USTVR|nr:hypothetical protein UVI_02035780 [Ustilaginoidea virens]
MAGKDERVSTYTSTSAESDGRYGELKRNLWTSMLESVASGKRLPQKNLLVLDTLARVSLYLLSQPSNEFASLVSPLLTAQTVSHSAIVVLLDWSQPHQWLRQIWRWIRVLGEVMGRISAGCRSEMEDVMASWKERGRAGASLNLDGTPTATGASADGDGLLPLGPGEWSEPLGLPLCVVCQNAQKMEFLEKNKGWKEVDFDTVLQYMRTILLRHGASLIYTSQNTPSQLPLLIHSTLGITSLLKRQPLKHNVIDRDKIAVAPNWDSWGKIRILGGIFDAELVSKGWEQDIKLPLGSSPGAVAPQTPADDDDDDDDDDAHPPQTPTRHGPSAIAQYEDWCRDPNSGGLAVVESAMRDGRAVGVDSDDPQEFLERQLKILEAFKAKAPEKGVNGTSPLTTASHRRTEYSDEQSVNDHIGPVQFNMGGIQVDADDMLQRLKVRASHEQPGRGQSRIVTKAPLQDRNAHLSPDDEYGEEEEPVPVGNMAKEYDNEQLQNFFSGLMNRTAGAADSPRS